MLKHLVLVGIALISFNAFASLEDVGTTASAVNGEIWNHASGPQIGLGPLQKGVYIFNSDTAFIPQAYTQNGQEIQNAAQQEIMIEKNQPVYIKFRDDGRIELAAQIDADMRGTVPDSFILSREDFSETDMSFQQDIEETAFADFYYDYEQVASGRCLYFVEKHFGLSLGVECPVDIGSRRLAGVGFHSVSCNSPSAQMKVWGGGHPVTRHPSKCGHIAYRTGHGGWSSTDFVGDPGPHYYVIGCYARGGSGGVSKGIAHSKGRYHR